MAEMSERSLSTAEQKQRIRERYKGVDESKIEIIPAAPQEDFFHSEVHKRVAVYARVSTDDPRQTSSYELQRNHYTDFVNQHINWELVDIYADEGISGTSLLHRDAFKRMISDCKAGKIDLIVTKSVSRFARNIIDCIGYVRELKALTPPVEVFFEIKYTEREFSQKSSAKDPHAQYESIYKPMIEKAKDIFENGTINENDFNTKYYQLARNSIRAISTEKHVFFVCPENHDKLVQQFNEFKSCLTKEGTERVRLITWEKIVKYAEKDEIGIDVTSFKNRYLAFMPKTMETVCE